MFYHHMGGSRPKHVQLFGPGVGKIYYPVINKGAAVIHIHQTGAAIALVGDPYLCTQGQHFVGSGHAVHIIAFPTGSGLSVEISAIPGSNAFFLKPVGRLQGVIGLPPYGIGLEPALAIRGSAGLLRRRLVQ